MSKKQSEAKTKPQLKLESVAINTLAADPDNVRMHGERNIESIKSSLERFGQQKPIVVGSDGVVIAGNGTLVAAIGLGWKNIGIVRSELKGSEAVAFAIADNRTAELAEWDDVGLAKQLAALRITDDTLAELTGFSQTDISEIGLLEQIENEPLNFRFDPVKYTSRMIKQIVLLFGLEEYERVFDAAAAYAEKHGLSNNSEVFVHLLEKNGHAISERRTKKN